jgi:ABC-type uncharacterized transport system substrate-binding protein
VSLGAAPPAMSAGFSTAHPGALPVEIVNVPALAINLNTAKALRLTIPHALLARVDEVIE